MKNNHSMDWGDAIDNYGFTEVILSSPAYIDVTVFGNLRIEMIFTWLGTSHNFIITKWMGPKFQSRASAFLQHAVRDSSVFGSLRQDGSVAITAVQRNQLMHQCYIDIVSAIKMIVTHYQSSLLDYAVWYLDKRPRDGNRSEYTELVTVTACDCLIHAGILANSNWNIVEFK